MILKRDAGFYIASNPSCLFVSVRSNQIITINSTPPLFTVLSNLVLVILSTETFESVNKDLSCSIFEGMLFMLIC